MTQNVAAATHLAAPGILRTPKFITALAYAPSILSTAYVDDLLDSDKPLNPGEYPLRDHAMEKKLGFTLQESCERARKNGNKLLAGHEVYCVEDIHGGAGTMKTIVEVNGGSCQPFHGRPLSIPSRRADSDKNENMDAVLLSGTSKENKKLWSKFQQAAESARKVPRIVRSDWLLDTAMGQAVLPFAAFVLKGDD